MYIFPKKYAEKFLNKFRLFRFKSVETALVCNERLIKEVWKKKVKETFNRKLGWKLVLPHTKRLYMMFASLLRITLVLENGLEKEQWVIESNLRRNLKWSWLAIVIVIGEVVLIIWKAPLVIHSFLARLYINGYLRSKNNC